MTPPWPPPAQVDPDMVCDTHTAIKCMCDGSRAAAATKRAEFLRQAEEAAAVAVSEGSIMADASEVGGEGQGVGARMHAPHTHTHAHTHTRTHTHAHAHTHTNTHTMQATCPPPPTPPNPHPPPYARTLSYMHT